MFKSKKKLFVVFLIVFLAFLLPAGLILSEWCLAGGGFKRLYYRWKYNENKIRIVEDTDFAFYKQGYSKTYDLKSDYYTPHRILLIPNSKSVPIEYEYSGEILVEIFDAKNNLLQSTKSDSFSAILRRKEGGDYYGNYLIYIGKAPRHARSIFAFEIGTIPFDLIRLKWKRLKEMKVKVTVVKPDENLKEFCESAKLVIIPDLRT